MLVCLGLRSHSLPPFIYFGSRGCYSLASLQSSWLILFASCYPFFSLGFRYYYYCYYYFTLVYFDRLPLNAFRCDWGPRFCCLILCCFLIIGVRARGWVANCWPQEWFHPPRVGLLAKCSVACHAHLENKIKIVSVVPQHLKKTTRSLV